MGDKIGGNLAVVYRGGHDSPIVENIIMNAMPGFVDVLIMRRDMPKDRRNRIFQSVIKGMGRPMVLWALDHAPPPGDYDLRVSHVHLLLVMEHMNDFGLN